MNKREHKELAEHAAADIKGYLAADPAEFRVRVWGNPPTISLQLSIGAAHHLIDAIKQSTDGQGREAR